MYTKLIIIKILTSNDGDKGEAQGKKTARV